MSITVQNIFEWVMAIADELSDSGTVSPSDTNAYKYRSPAILNTLQAELLTEGDIFSTHDISHKPSAVAVGSFDVAEYVGDELTYEGNSNCYGYYFEIDGEGTVYIEDYTSAWNTLSTVTVPNTVTDFTSYKGIVTPTSGATKSRIRFTGTYRYLVKNYCLFKYNMPLTRLPDYRPWIKKEMPSDFKSALQIIQEQSSEYIAGGEYKWEGNKDLYLSWDFEGNIRIVYKPVPDAITATTDTVQVDDVTARTLLVYGLGMELYKDENETLYKHFKDKFYEQKLAANENKPTKSISITNYYGSI